MNIIGEYNIQYNIYTMFDVYNVKIKNHNLITKKGYEFFLNKWYKDDESYPIQLGYYHENNFYNRKNLDDTYSYELKNDNGSYSTSIIFADKDNYKQYLYNGEKFVEYHEKLDKICVGKYSYLDEERTKPSENDTELYNPSKEFDIDSDGFIVENNSLIMKSTINKEDLDGTTEIGVKTNRGRLVSHDIHAPYYLPQGNDIILEYVFKLKKEE